MNGPLEPGAPDRAAECLEGAQCACAGESTPYLGGITFGSTQGDPVTMTLQEWIARAVTEYALYRMSDVIMRKSDTDLEDGFRKGDLKAATLAVVAMIEELGSWIKAYEGGAEILTSAQGRLIVIAERLVGRDVVEACWREGAS